MAKMSSMEAAQAIKNKFEEAGPELSDHFGGVMNNGLMMDWTPDLSVEAFMEEIAKMEEDGLDNKLATKARRGGY